MLVFGGRSVPQWGQGGAGVGASGRPAGRTVRHHRGQWQRIRQPGQGRLILPPRHSAGLYSPGKPVENGCIESFNGRLRDECLNVEVFFTLEDVRKKLWRWQQDYNQVRAHSECTGGSSACGVCCQVRRGDHTD